VTILSVLGLVSFISLFMALGLRGWYAGIILVLALLPGVVGIWLGQGDQDAEERVLTRRSLANIFALATGLTLLLFSPLVAIGLMAEAPMPSLLQLIPLLVPAMVVGVLEARDLSRDHSVPRRRGPADPFASSQGTDQRG
jgi:hypothetical protein